MKIIVTSFLRCGSTYLCDALSQVCDTQWQDADVTGFDINPPCILKTHKHPSEFGVAHADYVFSIRRNIVHSLGSLLLWYRTTRSKQPLPYDAVIQDWCVNNPTLTNEYFINWFVQEHPDFVRAFAKDWTRFQQLPEPIITFRYETFFDSPFAMVGSVLKALNKRATMNEVIVMSSGISSAAMHMRYPFNHVNPGPVSYKFTEANRHFIESCALDCAPEHVL